MQVFLEQHSFDVFKISIIINKKEVNMNWGIFDVTQKGIALKKGSAGYAIHANKGSTGDVSVIGNGKRYVYKTYNEVNGVKYKYPTMVLNVGGFSQNHKYTALSSYYGGALCLTVPDGRPAGGNQRGHNSVDLQMGRTSSTQVASGYGGFTAGTSNTASGAYSTALGLANTASGFYSMAIGYVNSSTAVGAYTFGYGNTTSLAYSTTLGYRGTSKAPYSVTLGARSHTNLNAKNQVNFISLVNQTTSTTSVRLTPDSEVSSSSNAYVPSLTGVSLNQFVLTGISSTNKVVVFEGKFCLKKENTAASTALVGAVTSTQTYSDPELTGCTLSITADTTLGSINASVTGISGYIINWAMRITSTEQMF